MIIYIDYEKFICYIVAPKCGNWSIAHHLKVGLFKNYGNTDEILADEKFTKIIILRSVYSRFLSGFYEDLFKNDCHNDINITFDEYLDFLKKITDNKEKNVDTIDYIYNFEKQIKPIYWGQCSNKRLPITDNDGILCTHNKSFKKCVDQFVQCSTNIKLLKLNNLSDFLGSNKKKNVKEKKYDLNIGNIKLNVIKKERHIMDEEMLTQSQKDIIDHMYNEDNEYLDYLENTYKYVETINANTLTPTVVETINNTVIGEEMLTPRQKDIIDHMYNENTYKYVETINANTPTSTVVETINNTVIGEELLTLKI